MRAGALPRLLLRAGLLLAALVLLHYGGRIAATLIEAQLPDLGEGAGTSVLAAVIVVYVLLMALPFVPGIEISLAVLMIFGMQGVPIVYLATLFALTLAFVIGQRIPVDWIARLLAWLHLERASDLMRRLAPMPAEQRVRLITRAAPARWLPFLLRHRYLAVAVAFNVPGNALIGGGGGIAMVAGLSGLFRLPHYVLMVSIAISPVPLIMLLGNRVAGG